MGPRPEQHDQAFCGRTRLPDDVRAILSAFGSSVWPRRQQLHSGDFYHDQIATD
jgi:hypothetical protein